MILCSTFALVYGSLRTPKELSPANIVPRVSCCLAKIQTNPAHHAHSSFLPTLITAVCLLIIFCGLPHLLILLHQFSMSVSSVSSIGIRSSTCKYQFCISSNSVQYQFQLGSISVPTLFNISSNTVQYLFFCSSVLTRFNISSNSVQYQF